MTEKIEYKGYTIKVELDEDNESPREWDNAGKMVCFHNNYNLGDKHDFYNAADFMEWLEENEKDLIYLPLYLYDHSGISMSTSTGYPFNCPWDSGQVGFIYLDRETMLKEWGYKNITKKRREFIENILRGEVAIYDQYLTGEIYGYIVEDEEGEHLDSCWGFYDKEDMINEAESIIDYKHKNTYHQMKLIPA